MLKASGVYEAFFIEIFQPVYRNRSIIPQYRKNLVPSPHTAGKPAYQNQAFTCESKRSIRCHSMEMVDKHRECLKRISTPVISIGKRIPEFNRVRLWFDNNLADHFIRFLQGNGNHKRRFSRQNICSTALNRIRRVHPKRIRLSTGSRFRIDNGRFHSSHSNARSFIHLVKISFTSPPAPGIFYLTEYSVSETDRPETEHRS